MSATSVQFTVASHLMAALGYHNGKEIASATLAASVNADPTFVRKSLSKLSKAGLRTNDQRSPNRSVEPTSASTSCPCSCDVWRPGRMLETPKSVKNRMIASEIGRAHV